MKTNPLRSAAINEKKKKMRWALWLMVIFLMAVLAGCDGDDDDFYWPPTYETQILSDLDYDGDITFSAPDSYTVSSARVTESVLAGIDPVSGDEFRGFLAFPIRGAGRVPLYADIESASLEVYINRVDESAPGVGVPLLFDLVSFSPPSLIAGDFDRAALLTLYSNIVFIGDAGDFLTFDVTPLMVEAQRRGLTYFQIRILLDSALASSGYIEIDDYLAATAPLLTVTYY